MQIKFTVTSNMIEEMVDTIVREVNPVRVVLFGSCATNTARLDSDIDLLVIEELPFGPTRSRRAESVKLWSSLARFRVPKDILVFTEEEVIHLKDVFDHVVYHAMKDGRVLYDRA